MVDDDSDESLTNEHSANAPANGYNFQYVAALYIYLQYIDRVEWFGVEKKEDIELNLLDGNKVFGQAKSSLVPDQISIKGYTKEIGKSVGTLSAASKKAQKHI